MRRGADASGGVDATGGGGGDASVGCGDGGHASGSGSCRSSFLFTERESQPQDDGRQYHAQQQSTPSNGHADCGEISCRSVSSK